MLASARRLSRNEDEASFLNLNIGDPIQETQRVYRCRRHSRWFRNKRSTTGGKGIEKKK